MMQSKLQYKAQALRLEKIIFATESILIYIAALFTSALLPSLLMQYVIKSDNPFETPAVLNYIPVTAFLIATAFFIYSLIAVSTRALEIKRLDKEMENMNSDCCCGDDLAELAQLEELAEKAVKSAKKKPATKAKKTTKKK